MSTVDLARRRVSLIIEREAALFTKGGIGDAVFRACGLRLVGLISGLCMNRMFIQTAQLAARVALLEKLGHLQQCMKLTDDEVMAYGDRYGERIQIIDGDYYVDETLIGLL